MYACFLSAAELEPTITSARQKTVETWARLPGPVQAALPFVAVGATVAFGVKLVSDRALFQEVPAPFISLAAPKSQPACENGGNGGGCVALTPLLCPGHYWAVYG